MSDYTKQLEQQNEELREKLAATQKELEETKAKLNKWNSGYNTALNELVSVQPMTAPVGQVHWIGYREKNTKNKIRLLAS